MRLALDTDDDLWERVENEEVPVAIAMEVRQAPLDARPALVERAIERAAGGAPMTRDEMRVDARAERDRTGVQRRKPSVSGPRVARGARPWMSERLIQPPRAEELYFPDVLAACTPPQAFCALAHDLSQWLDRFHAALLASGEAEHVDLRDLRAILARKTLRDQMQTHLADLTM